MPKLWTETVEEHRRAVHEAALDATAALVAELGLGAVTMSQIAQRTGIGRATLYRYFPDVETLLTAWHARQVTDHLRQLAHVRDSSADGDRLEGVLLTYAGLTGRHANSELAVQLHRGAHVAHARRHLRDFLRDLLAEATAAGELRDDVPPDELADYVLGALSAAAGLHSDAAVRRLVAVTLAGLRPSA
jgi:AcrR family transcriptional regulator